MKKGLSVLLALIMIISIIPMSTITASAATTPSSVSSSEAYNKIYELFEILGDKSFFTTTHTNSCGEKSSGHSCSYCKLSTIITQTWFKNKFGTLSTSQFPKTYYPSGEAKGPDGWSCFGFASFAEWYVFKTKVTDKVTTKYVGTFDSNYSNASSYVKVGDLIRFGSSHSGIVISCDSTGIKVLDCNWGNVTYNCQIQIHTVKYSYCSAFTISRATNSFASSSTPTPEICNCSTSYAGNYTCTTTNSSLFIRSGHGTSYSTIGSIPKGATVYVSKANGSWAHVTYNGVSGYASMSYLTKQTTQKPTLSLSTNVVNLTLGGTETQTVQVTVNNVTTVNGVGNGKGLSIEGTSATASWSNNSSILITAVEQGKTIVGIELYEAGCVGGTPIDTAYITVNVSAKTYTVSYNANGGTGAPASQTKTHGTALTLSNTIPTRTGYTFLGWSTSSTATSATYSAGSNFTTNANTTLYAVWKSDRNNYIRVWFSDSVCGDELSEYYVGTWYWFCYKMYDKNTGDNLNSYISGDYAVDISIYDPDGHIICSASDIENKDEGCLNFKPLFAGEYKAVVSVDGIVSGQFTEVIEVVSKTYTVSYNANGGTGAPSSQLKTHGVILALSSVVPTRAGYTFLGWSTSSTATSATYSAGDNFTINANTTLYAVWQKNPVTPDVPDTNFTFSIQQPSRTEIRNKDGIILHANVDGTAPNGSYVKWESSNGNFDKSADGSNLKIVAKNKGWTTFTAILCDADGNELARDTVEMYSKSGFFDKIGGFFRSLFGTTKVYEN